MVYCQWALAPMIPFIMLSNCLYIEVFSRFYDREKLAKSTLALLLASLVKTVFLFLIVKFLMQALLAQSFIAKSSNNDGLATIMDGSCWRSFCHYFEQKI